MIFGLLLAGVMATLQANDLPNPVVEVSISDSQKYAVAAARTLQVRFGQSHMLCFAIADCNMQHVTCRFAECIA